MSQAEPKGRKSVAFANALPSNIVRHSHIVTTHKREVKKARSCKKKKTEKTEKDLRKMSSCVLCERHPTQNTLREMICKQQKPRGRRESRDQSHFASSWQRPQCQSFIDETTRPTCRGKAFAHLSRNACVIRTPVDSGPRFPTREIYSP